MVATDAAQAAALKTGARADFEKVLNSEKDSKKRETLVKERELLDGILILSFCSPPLKLVLPRVSSLFWPVLIFASRAHCVHKKQERRS